MLKKIKDNKIISSAAGLFFSFAGGFLFSGDSISGAVSFADISLAGALNLPCAAAAFAGAVVRCVLTGSVGKCIVKLAAIAVIVIAKMFSRVFSNPTGCGIITAVGVLFSGLSVSWLIGEFVEKLFFYGIYGFLSGFTAYAAASLYDEFSRKSIITLKGTNVCYLGIVYVVVCGGLYSAEMPFINAGLVVITAVTAFSAYYYGGISGVICSALGASGAFLASSEKEMIVFMLPVAALLTGFAGKGRLLLSAVIFILSGFMLTVFAGLSVSAEVLFGMLCGIGIFIAGTPYYSDKWLSMTGEKAENPDEIKGMKNNFMSDVIDAVCSDSAKISAALTASQRKIEMENPNRNSVCMKCYRRGLCRDELWDISEENIPVLPDDCVHKKEAAEESERMFRMRTVQKLMELRYSDDRKFMKEQFRIISELVRESGKKEEIRYSSAVSSRIDEALRSHNIKVLRTVAGYTAANRLTADIFYEAGEITESSERICGILSDTLGVRVVSSAAVSSEKELKTGIYEPPDYKLEIHSAAMCAAGSKLSGDSSASFTDSMGKQYVVLSDGMGSGKSAAVDSHIVIGLFRRLVCSGLKPELAVRIVNSVMVTKSREESFATLDALIIDLDECSVMSVKSGAAPTIIRKGRDVIKLSSPVFPIGIVEEAELCVSEQKLSEGDMIIMFSDGITENAYLFIKELLLRGDDIKEIVREITAKAEVFNPASRSDDVTVIGIKMTRV